MWGKFRSRLTGTGTCRTRSVRMCRGGAALFSIGLNIGLVLASLGATSVYAQTFSVVYSFPGDSLHGNDPHSTLILDADGSLYGTTSMGGPGCDPSAVCGTLFKIDTSGKESILHSFTSQSSGTQPGGNLFRDNAGNFYGTTSFGGDSSDACNVDGASYGCGTVFKIDTSGRLTVLHRFLGGANGTFPFGLTGDGAGNLYGLTQAGGINCPDSQPSGCGVVFKLEPNGTFSILHRFSGGADGASPNGPLAIDSEGNLFGTTYIGGQSNTGSCVDGCGTIFKIDKFGLKTTLFEFTGLADGGNPMGGLLLDASGNLYGTTFYGGNMSCPSGCGVVFKLDSSGSQSVLYSFRGEYDGATPNGNLIRDEATGNLYGITRAGGYSCDRYGDTCGVVFKLDSSGQETVLHAFTDSTDGGFPVAGLTMDPQGNLYGTASDGGLMGDTNCYTGCGVIFRIAASDTLNLTEVAYPTPPAQGNPLTYAFKVGNNNSVAAVHEVLTTSVPSGTTFSSITLSGTGGVGSCTTPAVGDSGSVVCEEGSRMRPGSTWTVRMTVQVTAPAGTVLTESAIASSDNLGSSSATIHNTVH